MQAVYAALTRAGVANSPAGTVIGSTIYANKPGDGSAREQAASCQRVLGACANIAMEYATKRYRSNCINWGMAPLLTATPEDYALGDWVFVPGIREAILSGRQAFDAYVVKADGSVKKDERFHRRADRGRAPDHRGRLLNQLLPQQLISKVIYQNSTYKNTASPIQRGCIFISFFARFLRLY